MALVTALATALPVLAPAPVSAFGNSGAYLAARQASFGSDFKKAAEYYTRALALDLGNPTLMENAVGSFISLGAFDRALPIARRMDEGDVPSQVASMAVLADLITRDAYDTILVRLETGRSIGPLIDGLVAAWAQLGAGLVAPAMESFDEIAAQQGLKSFGLYHKALALAAVGDFEGADEILSGRAEGPLTGSRRVVLAHAQILSQLERGNDAVELIETAFGPNPAPIFAWIRTQIAEGGAVPYDVAASPREGLAEVFYSAGSVLSGDAAPGYALLYTRMAEVLDPEHVDAILLSAALLEELEQYDLATDTYDRVPRSHPDYVTAALGRAAALQADGRAEAAIEAMTQLADDHPELLLVQMAKGDMLRRLDRYADAGAAYDRAIALIGDPQPRHWVNFFARGITHERTDRWPEAEADLRMALELSPDQPQVLNYLGYSLVELRTDLDEALDMIERAVAGRPDDGYITDSLGWALYRLGRYEEAVVHMERAAELMPTDPIINDHLGDVYWAVGRRMEAQFQWRRALSFDPEEDEAARIRRKLEVGLDTVLVEEGADPIDVAKDG